MSARGEQISMDSEEVNLLWASSVTTLELVVRRAPDVRLPSGDAFRPDRVVVSIVKLDLRPQMTIIASGHRVRRTGVGLLRSRADMEWTQGALTEGLAPEWIAKIAADVAPRRVIIENAVTV